MAYFNHAYRQTWVPSSLVIAKGTATSALKKGELAFIDAATYKSVNIPSGAGIGLGTSAANGTTAVVGGTGTPVVSNMGMPSTSGYILAQGNFNLSGTNTAASPGAGEDTIGTGSTGSDFPMHGGYAESYKSKIIIPKFITGLYRDDNICGTVAAAVVQVEVGDECIKCDGSTSLGNQLRLDFKGNAVLRYLNRFAYSTYYVKDCCAAGVANVTGAAVVAELVKQINDDPIVSPFVTATAVTGSSGDNILQLTVGYTATFFDNCSFDTRDNVDTEPLTMKVGMLDEDGDACVDSCFTQRTGTSGDFAAFPDNSTVEVALMKEEKTGENVLRDLILDRRYSQDGGHNQGNRDSARFREIEKGDNILAAVDRTTTYRNYKIQHTVPRYNNPTGVFDNDQYLYEIHIPCATGSDALYANLGKFVGGLAVEAQAAGRFVPVTTL